MSIGTTVNSTMSTVVVLFFPFLVIWFGISIAFVIFGGIMVLGTIYAFLDMVETKGLDKSFISNLITSSDFR